MKLRSIRNKVIAMMLICLTVGLIGMLSLMHFFFNRSAKSLAENSLSGAHNLFAVSESQEIGKMSVLTELLNSNPQFGDALLAKDRGKLIELTAPLYLKLRDDGLTAWTFHTPKPEMAPFLRLHDPAQNGDHLGRFIDDEVSRQMSTITGNQFDRDGFALRTIAPLFATHGEIAGYVEFGQDLGNLLRNMKKNTGEDYGLLLNKKFIDHLAWTTTRNTLGRSDNWNDAPSTVLFDQTSASAQIAHFDGDLSSLPAAGKVLERYREGNSVLVRSVFPVQDAAGNNVGAIFVAHDITANYLAMRRTEVTLALLAVLAGIAVTAIFLFLLNTLIFQRLNRIIRVATNLAGGDYETEIAVSSDDEVGQFESLFEQFRKVFISVLAHVPELQK